MYEQISGEKTPYLRKNVKHFCVQQNYLMIHVTTHLLNQLVLKMDDAGELGPYLDGCSWQSVKRTRGTRAGSSCWWFPLRVGGRGKR